MNEHSFIRSVHRVLPREVYRWKIHDNFNNEVVDAFYHVGGLRHLWVEYKYRKVLPKRPQTLIVPELSERQKDWLSARAKAGLPVAVIVGSPEGHVWFENQQEWEAGITAESFRSRAVPTRALAEAITAFLTFTGVTDDDQSHDHGRRSVPGQTAAAALGP